MMVELNIFEWTIPLMFFFIIEITLNKNLNLPAGGSKCLYEPFIHSIRSKPDSFRN